MKCIGNQLVSNPSAKVSPGTHVVVRRRLVSVGLGAFNNQPGMGVDHGEFKVYIIYRKRYAEKKV